MAATSHMLDLGTVAPDFDLADPDDNRVTRDDAAGEHGLLVAFVCNHCPYVKHVGRELGLLTQRWMSRGSVWSASTATIPRPTPTTPRR